MRRNASTLLAAIFLAPPARAQPQPIPIKVVVVAMFERGADTGDQPGELQFWVERERLDRIVPFPQGYHDGKLGEVPRPVAGKPLAARPSQGQPANFRAQACACFP